MAVNNINVLCINQQKTKPAGALYKKKKNKTDGAHALSFDFVELSFWYNKIETILIAVARIGSKLNDKLPILNKLSELAKLLIYKKFELLITARFETNWQHAINKGISKIRYKNSVRVNNGDHLLRL